MTGPRSLYVAQLSPSDVPLAGLNLTRRFIPQINNRVNSSQASVSRTRILLQKKDHNMYSYIYLCLRKITYGTYFMLFILCTRRLLQLMGASVCVTHNKELNQLKKSKNM